MPVRSLRGQSLLIMLAGLFVSHSVAISIYSDDRGDALTLTEAEDMAERIAGMVLLISQLPPDLHKTVANASTTSTFRVTVDDDANFVAPTDRVGEIESRVYPFLSDLVGRSTPGWRVLSVRTDALEGAGRAPSEGPTHRSRINGSSTPSQHVLSASVQGEGDRTLNFETLIPERRTAWPEPVGYYILFLTAVVLGLSAWSVTRVTRPLETFAIAAENLGKNILKTPLREEGPVELITAARALNAMQDRLKRLVDNRTQILIAISHDLRTPLTLLRLRAELLPDDKTRGKFLNVFNDMDRMITSFLEFARQGSHQERRRLVDVAALLDSICSDLSETGSPVKTEITEQTLIVCQPNDLRRALMNLVDNSIKYGGSAFVSLRETSDAVDIRIEDDGPGIPQDRLATICMPFVRGEDSRNTASGGLGLGLSIAQMIVEAHGGELSVTNRPQGGALAHVVLPR